MEESEINVLRSVELELVTWVSGLCAAFESPRTVLVKVPLTRHFFSLCKRKKVDEILFGFFDGQPVRLISGGGERKNRFGCQSKNQ